MFVYNLTMIVVNIYFFYRSFWWTDYGRELFDYKFPTEHDKSERALEMINLSYWYMLTKFVDYFDTWFFILRKKNSQISALHVYHHVSVPVVGWYTHWTRATMPQLAMFALVNTPCHILMYSYYALSSLGPSVVLANQWWKPYITRIQLVQFVAIGAYGLALLIGHEDYPLVNRLLPVSQAAIYLVLFGRFYRQAYNPKKNIQTVGNGSKGMVDDTVDQCNNNGQVKKQVKKSE